jgi:hypothetical protein
MLRPTPGWILLTTPWHHWENEEDHEPRPFRLGKACRAMPDARRPRPNGHAGDDGQAPPKESIVDYLILLAPAIAAVIGGVIVAFRTGDFWPLAMVVVGGTVVGYVACAAVFFTIGHILERRGRLQGRAADAFFVFDMAVGVFAAITIALLAASSLQAAFQGIVAVLAVAVAAVVVLAVTN